MGVRRSAAVAAGTAVAPKVGWSFVRAALERAIDGAGPLRSAGDSSMSHLVDAGGDVEKAIASLVRVHTALAGAQGFVTNLGGIVALPLAVPANIAGVTLVQCHLVAGIAHLRGWDLDDPRVRNAILTCLLGEETVEQLVEARRLPAGPMGLATAPTHSAELDRMIGTEVTTELVGRTVGRRAVTLAARRVPAIGGVVAAGTDGWATRQIGQYAARELRDRRLP